MANIFPHVRQASIWGNITKDIYPAIVSQAICMQNTYGVKRYDNGDMRPNIFAENLARILEERGSSFPPLELHYLDISKSSQPPPKSATARIYLFVLDSAQLTVYREYSCNRMEGFISDARIIVRDHMKEYFTDFAKANEDWDGRPIDHEALAREASLFLDGALPSSTTSQATAKLEKWPEGVHDHCKMHGSTNQVNLVLLFSLLSNVP
jgi:hypothetical protein